MIVVDASAVIEMLLHSPAAAAVERRIFGSRETLHAPHLLDVEVAHAFRRYAAAGAMSSERGHEALTLLIDFPVQRHPHRSLLARIWTLRNNLTVYDAAYVALAEALDAPLITRDRRLARSSGHRARVELV